MPSSTPLDTTILNYHHEINNLSLFHLKLGEDPIQAKHSKNFSGLSVINGT